MVCVYIQVVNTLNKIKVKIEKKLFFKYLFTKGEKGRETNLSNFTLNNILEIVFKLLLNTNIQVIAVGNYGKETLEEK